MREIADALWEGHTLLEDWTECAQTHTQTKVKTVYPLVSLRSIGGYKYNVIVGYRRSPGTPANMKPSLTMPNKYGRH